MQRDDLEKLLGAVALGETSVKEAIERLQTLPFESLPYARVDHHRQLRQGAAEVIFGQGKTSEQIVGIAGALSRRGATVLITRTTEPVAEALTEALGEGGEVAWYRTARCAVVSTEGRDPPALPGRVGVLCAGTSDLPVAEEAAVALEFYGATVTRLTDVGVAGLHRLLGDLDTLLALDVVIVVAGMEGALPSVVGGLVAAPVIAVPTSVGYGASFQGLAALLGMLNSCAAGVTVVNIDNGFGAAAAAHRMLLGVESSR